MAYSYDRTKTADALPLHKPAEADEALTKAYLALHSFKFGFDQMEEIPQQYLPVYNEIMKALDKVGEAQKHTHQLRHMTRRLPR